MLELYDKKVKVVNSKTGDVTYTFLRADIGMEKVREGGEYLAIFGHTFT